MSHFVNKASNHLGRCRSHFREKGFVSNGFVSSKIYNKRDDFDIVNVPFLDGDVPRSTSYGVYISQLIRFVRVSSHVADFNARNKSLTCQTSPTGLSVS